MIELTIKLSKKQIAELARGKAIHLTIRPREERQAISPLLAEGVSKDIQKLVALWNDDDFIKYDAIDESRNNPFPEDKTTEYHSQFRKAIDSVGFGGIRDSMHKYFEACERREHIGDGINKGFLHLGGFIGKLLKLSSKSGIRKKGWWEKERMNYQVADKHPKLTEKLADGYASRFLGRARYGLNSSMPDYAKFKEAATMVHRMGADTGLRMSVLIGLLLDCVGERIESQGVQVSPGWLTNRMIWKNYLPQQIKRFI